MFVFFSSNLSHAQSTKIAATGDVQRMFNQSQNSALINKMSLKEIAMEDVKSQYQIGLTTTVELRK